MARVNMEEKFFARTSRRRTASAVMGWDERTLIGALALLWHDSQAELRTHGTAEEIRAWSLEPCDSKIIDAYVAGRYIRWDESAGQYEIEGNKEQIDGIVSKSENRKKGGEATRKKWAALKEGLKQAASHADSPLPAMLNAGVEQAQCNAMQCNALNSSDGHPPSGDAPSAPKKKAAKKKGEPAESTTLVWEPYRRAFFARYRVEPARSAETNRQAALLLSRVPKEHLSEVVRFFLDIDDNFYTQKFHPLGLLLRDVQTVYTKWQIDRTRRSDQPEFSELPTGMEDKPIIGLREKVLARGNV